MAGITGMGTTFDLPNFVGDLFNISPEDTPLLSAIGGLTGGRPAYDKRFEWEFYDLRAAAANRQRLEGAAAPTAEGRVRANAHNVVEIHQEAVSVSYTRQALGNRGGYGNMVEIDHGFGIRTRYAHLSKITVRQGMKVAKGATVGQVGSTGRSTGPHLHYEVLIDGHAVDPAAFIEAGRRLVHVLQG